MSNQDTSLKEIFTESRNKQKQLDDLDPRTETFKETLQSIINSLEQCRALIDKLAIFSTNEELEDISTQDLQYLTVDYLLAELLLKSYGVDREGSLRRASELLESFLTRLDLYGLLSTTDKKLYERYTENRTTFSIAGTANAEEKRNIKVARFREEKALKQKLEYLRNQSQSINIDDETVRSLYLAEVAFDVHQTFQALDMITQERAILTQMRQAAPTQSNGAHTEDERSRKQVDGYSERLDGPTTMAGLGRKGGPLLSSSGKPLQPFVLTDKRTQLQQGVFRPGHNLPTMSIDEYLEEEKRRGGIIEGGGNAQQPKAELDEDNMELVDKATMKAREWDEFVEANPKGAGNTLNRG